MFISIRYFLIMFVSIPMMFIHVLMLHGFLLRIIMLNLDVMFSYAAYLSYSFHMLIILIMISTTHRLRL